MARYLRKKGSKDFSPSRFSVGFHVFCDGAAIPNPGAGGWGVVVYEGGAEIATACGGDPETTNNQMELVGLLNAIEKAKALPGNPAATIWSDSQYCVKGSTEWMPGWKAKGWMRAGENAQPKNRVVMNVELWKAIDEALSSGAGNISIRWVKGHSGVVGNERADELAEQGRQAAMRESKYHAGAELDERYRQIMEVM
ncbi:ribonuclease H [Agrobacterium sp. CFBP2214]|uniref:ribonuclease H family protein n=1 Tax=Agrobacterium sp. CFBP2214 TaxID=3040274 RepID=UPI00254E3663|nr:ribonuclease H [Agrobacterium sp. CFBP2214]